MASDSMVLPLDADVSEALGPMDTFNYTFIYDFEKLSFGWENTFLVWMQKNWQWSVYLSAAYVAAIFVGQKYMRGKPPMNLRPLLAAWSSALAVFSIFGAYRCLPDLVHSIASYSFHHSVCHPNYFYGVTGFWSIAFVLSKPWELGDTLFIVLRKQSLIFLHWYHHITVMMYVWVSYSEHTAPGRWFFAMNYTVHAFMYSYYALRAMQFRLPRWMSISITGMQILQMLIGCGVFVYVYMARSAGRACQISESNAMWGALMYLSYLLLFSEFFYSRYMRRGRQQQQQPAAKRQGSEVQHVLKSVADIDRQGFVKKID